MMRTSVLPTLASLILLGSSLSPLARGEEAATPIEPQLDSSTLEDGRRSLQPLVMTAKRVRVDEWILTITQDKITATAEGETEPAWTVESEQGDKLHLLTHSGDRAYFVAYPGGNEVQVLDLKSREWLGHLADGKTGTLAAVSAHKGHVAVLRLNRHAWKGNITSYDVTLFGEDHSERTRPTGHGRSLAA